jgi:anti-sigma regulatory factor (Ser/Thr protein kinase)
MSAGSGQLTVDAEGHVVQFYGGDRELAASVGGYPAGGIEAGGMVVAVATQPHRLAFEAGLRAAGVDVGAAGASGRPPMLDAPERLRGFLVGGRLDHDRFEAAVGGLVRRVASAGRLVRTYAETVALLWDAGRVTVALKLGELWNDPRPRFPFSLPCGYPARPVTDDPSAAEVEAACRPDTGAIGPQPGQPEAEKKKKRKKKTSGAEAEEMRSFPGVLEAARAARHFVTGVLRPRHDQALTQDAAIVTAELAANAVLHAGSAFTVAVSQSIDGVRISVQDASPMLPAAWNRSPMTSPDHGLGVVSTIASRWAVEPLPDGKVVWAELPASPKQAR